MDNCSADNLKTAIEVATEGALRLNKAPCPCCGNYTLPKAPEAAFYEICPVCYWQNEGSEETAYSSANRSTLKEYRAAYQKNNKDK